MKLMASADDSSSSEAGQNENKCVDILACGRIFEVTNGQFPLGPGQSPERPRVGFFSLPFKCYVGNCFLPWPSISFALKTAKNQKFGASKTREVEENPKQHPSNLALNTFRTPYRISRDNEWLWNSLVSPSLERL